MKYRKGEREVIVSKQRRQEKRKITTYKEKSIIIKTISSRET